MLQKLVSLLSGNWGAPPAPSESAGADARPLPPPEAAALAGGDERPAAPDEAGLAAPPTPVQAPAQAPAAAMGDAATAPQHLSVESAMMQYEDFTAVAYSQAQLAASKQELTDLTRHCKGVYGVIIHTGDGHDVLSILTQELHSKKIATMTSSFLALGETIARESQQSQCQYAMLENSNGRVISLRINDILMLTCISSKDSNPGMLLNIGKRTADAISKILAARSA